MRVALFGATGKTGRHFFALALESGHSVRALVRDPSKLKAPEARASQVDVVRGDVTDPRKVSETVAGAESVVNLLGHAPGSPKDIMVRSTQHIIEAANEHAVRLVICMSTAGVKSPEDAGSLGQSLMRLYLQTFERAQMKDHQAMCDLMRGTKDVGFEWVVVRAARLTDGASTRRYRVTTEGVPALDPHVARADVARCIVDLLTNGEYRRRMPFVC